MAQGASSASNDYEYTKCALILSSQAIFLGTWLAMIYQTSLSGYSWFTAHPLLQPAALALMTYGLSTS
jgi:hypothetical protein